MHDRRTFRTRCTESPQPTPPPASVSARLARSSRTSSIGLPMDTSASWSHAGAAPSRPSSRSRTSSSSSVLRTSRISHLPEPLWQTQRTPCPCHGRRSIANLYHSSRPRAWLIDMTCGSYRLPIESFDGSSPRPRPSSAVRSALLRATHGPAERSCSALRRATASGGSASASTVSSIRFATITRSLSSSRIAHRRDVCR